MAIMLQNFGKFVTIFENRPTLAKHTELKQYDACSGTSL